MNLITTISLSIIGSIILLVTLYIVYNHFSELRVKRFFKNNKKNIGEV